MAKKKQKLSKRSADRARSKAQAKKKSRAHIGISAQQGSKTRTLPDGTEVCIDIVTCPHCHRSGVAYAFCRHHFGNCKVGNEAYADALVERAVQEDIGHDNELPVGAN